MIAQLILAENKTICEISHTIMYNALAENRIRLKEQITSITINCKICAVCLRTWYPPILKLEYLGLKRLKD